MSKTRFCWINEFKKKPNKTKFFTPLHFHVAWCTCGCRELSIFLIILSLGFFVTINPTYSEKK